jgi:hypothetical protein
MRHSKAATKAAPRTRTCASQPTTRSPSSAATSPATMPARPSTRAAPPTTAIASCLRRVCYRRPYLKASPSSTAAAPTRRCPWTPHSTVGTARCRPRKAGPPSTASKGAPPSDSAPFAITGRASAGRSGSSARAIRRSSDACSTTIGHTRVCRRSPRSSEAAAASTCRPTATPSSSTAHSKKTVPSTSAAGAPPRTRQSQPSSVASSSTTTARNWAADIEADSKRCPRSSTAPFAATPPRPEAASVSTASIRSRRAHPVDSWSRFGTASSGATTRASTVTRSSYRVRHREF